tara:strand:+ start:9855 stop:10247 length:393 start_codon:yes stop_codon:yes gene_type:complete
LLQGIISEQSAMPNPKNLEPYRFKKGDPRIFKGGRPPNNPDLFEELQRFSRTGVKDKTNLARVVDKLGELALEGNMKAIEVFFAYLYGKPKQSVDITTDGETINEAQTVTIQIVRRSDTIQDAEIINTED